MAGKHSVQRREFLKAATGCSAALVSLTNGTAHLSADQARGKPAQRPLRNASALGDQFVRWQSSYGAPDLTKCPYRTRGVFGPGYLQSVGPMVRALYRLYGVTSVADYKAAADRSAVFFMNTIHDPPTPY